MSVFTVLVLPSVQDAGLVRQALVAHHLQPQASLQQSISYKIRRATVQLGHNNTHSIVQLGHNNTQHSTART